TSGRLSREIDSNMPSNKKRTSSIDLKPLVLEKLATTNTSRRSSRSSNSPVSARNSATSAFPLFKSMNESDDSLTRQHHQLGTMQAIMNVKIPFPVMILMMTTFIWMYNHLTVLYASS
ncbi:5295_t:CDS:1, partial [Acaulospora morrowiae]